jgi:plastocyanin
MKREPTKRADDFTKNRRYAACLLLPILLFSLTAAALGAEEPKGDKAAGTVEVRLSEHVIEMPNTLPAGPATFLIHNEGKKTHSFKIEGPGVDALLSAPVSPRASGQLQVTLQPGEYKVYCPIGSHEAKGMTMKLTVTAKQGG